MMPTTLVRLAHQTPPPPCRIAVRFCMAAIAILALSGRVVAAEQPVKGGELVFSLGSDLSSINPVLSTNIPDVMVGCGIYQGLVQVSSNFEITPLLAKSWTISDDLLTYDFALRDVKWSDGTPFTSADVAYSLMEINAKFSPVWRVSGSLVDKIDTPSPDRVVIHLKQPFAPFLMTLACIQGAAILPKHIFNNTDIRANPANSDAPVGTGPFTLVKWERGTSIELARNPNYWEKGKPYLDRLLGRLIPQSSSRLQALQAGEIDFIQGWTLAPSDQSTVRKNNTLKLETSGYASGTVMMLFNNKSGVTKDVRVRHALAMATDRDYILKTAWFGDGEVSTNPINRTLTWALNPTIDFSKMYPFDLAAANKMLDDAGYARNAQGTRFQVKVSYPSDAPDRAQAAIALKSMWAKAGVEVQPEGVERAIFVKQVYTDGIFDIGLEFLNCFGEPAIGVTRIYSSETLGRPYGNGSGYSNPVVDELFKKALSVNDRAARGKLYGEAEEVLAKDLPVFPFREARMQDGASSKLHDLWGVLGSADWTNAWLSQ